MTGNKVKLPNVLKGKVGYDGNCVAVEGTIPCPRRNGQITNPGLKSRERGRIVRRVALGAQA